MKTQGAFVFVCNKEQGILLVKRKDVPLWDLPGGRAEQDETVEEWKRGTSLTFHTKYMMCSILSTAGLRATKH